MDLIVYRMCPYCREDIKITIGEEKITIPCCCPGCHTPIAMEVKKNGQFGIVLTEDPT